MKYREFVYAGKAIPELTEQEHKEFLLHYQKSILASLKKRKLLNHSQYERCNEEIEKQHSKRNRSQV